MQAHAVVGTPLPGGASGETSAEGDSIAGAQQQASRSSNCGGTAMLGTSVVMEGVLKKRGEVLKQWKSRRFVLDTEDKVSYYSTKSSTKPKGFVDLSKLSSIHIEKDVASNSEKFTFAIEADGLRWLLAASSEFDMHHWIEVIRERRSRLVHSPIIPTRSSSPQSNMSNGRDTIGNATPRSSSTHSSPFQSAASLPHPQDPLEHQEINGVGATAPVPQSHPQPLNVVPRASAGNESADSLTEATLTSFLDSPEKASDTSFSKSPTPVPATNSQNPLPTSPSTPPPHPLQQRQLQQASLAVVNGREKESLSPSPDTPTADYILRRAKPVDMSTPYSAPNISLEQFAPKHVHPSTENSSGSTTPVLSGRMGPNNPTGDPLREPLLETSHNSVNSAMFPMPDLSLGEMTENEHKFIAISRRLWMIVCAEVLCFFFFLVGLLVADGIRERGDAFKIGSIFHATIFLLFFGGDIQLARLRQEGLSSDPRTLKFYRATGTYFHVPLLTTCFGVVGCLLFWIFFPSFGDEAYFISRIRSLEVMVMIELVTLSLNARLVWKADKEARTMNPLDSWSMSQSDVIKNLQDDRAVLLNRIEALERAASIQHVAVASPSKLEIEKEKLKMMKETDQREALWREQLQLHEKDRQMLRKDFKTMQTKRDALQSKVKDLEGAIIKMSKDLQQLNSKVFDATEVVSAALNKNQKEKDKALKEIAQLLASEPA